MKIEINRNLLFIVFAFLIFTMASSAYADYPSCLAGICFDKSLNNIGQVAHVFKSTKVKKGCSIIKSGGNNAKQSIYLLWNNEDLKSYLEELTIAENSKDIRPKFCEKTKLIPITDGGVGIGTSEDDLVKAHGKPTRIDDYSIDNSNISIGNKKKLEMKFDRKLVYLKNPESDLLTTYFYIKNQRVIGISISISE
jgi:hypothetical protein